jgi:hypothetical protein
VASVVETVNNDDRYSSLSKRAARLIQAVFMKTVAMKAPQK